MKSIRIRNILENVKYPELNLDLDTVKPFTYNLDIFKKEFNLTDLTKLRVIIIKPNEKKQIHDFNKSLEELGFKETDALQLERISMFEVSANLGISFAYFGPILVFLLFHFNYSGEITLTHRLALFLSIAHYAKRIFEVNFIHDYAKDTFSLIGIEIYGLTFYYWVLYGVSQAWFIYQEKQYENLSSLSNLKNLVFTLLMILSELGNFYSHYILKRIKDTNNGKRAVPRGFLFEYVSCSHYFCELVSWLMFSFVVNTYTSYLFVVYSFFAMRGMAVDKHANYLSFFKDYPKDRKAFIPFIL